MNAYRHLAAGATTPQNTRAWLFAIVHNAAINAVRAPQTPVALEEPHAAASGPTTAEMIEQREWMNWLMGAIGALPARQRDALVGHALEGRSYRELASREQTTVAAIKTLIHRARRGLLEGSPLHALAAPFVFVSRRLTGFAVRRALAGKLSANSVVGMVAAVIGTATLTSGLLLAVHADHSATALAAAQRSVRAHASSHRRSGGGGTGTPQINSTARLHHEARCAAAECERGRRLDRRLRGAALWYAASHLTATQMQYTECGHILRVHALQISTARGRRDAYADGGAKCDSAGRARRARAASAGRGRRLRRHHDERDCRSRRARSRDDYTEGARRHLRSRRRASGL